MNLAHVLAVGRPWTLYNAQACATSEINVKIRLSPIGIDSVTKHLLKEVPQYWGSYQYRLREWDAVSHDEHIIYDLESDSKNEVIQLNIVVVEAKYNAYVALYDKNGKLCFNSCLVIWNKHNCDVTNPGYGPGRCPIRISLPNMLSGYVQDNNRKACLSDVQDILKIQRMCYPQVLLEDEAVFRKIIEQDMSYIVFDSLDNQSVVGYALVHRIPNKYAPPDLNTTMLDTSDVEVWNVWKGHIFIHDVSVAPEWRGKGLASTMVYEIIDRASEAKSISLISVQDSQKFWEKHGFTKVNEDTQAPWINSYGEDAVHMTYVIT
jgi:GNAT superfamily N-acetyltransferase